MYKQVLSLVSFLLGIVFMLGIDKVVKVSKKCTTAVHHHHRQCVFSFIIFFLRVQDPLIFFFSIGFKYFCCKYFMYCVFSVRYCVFSVKSGQGVQEVHHYSAPHHRYCDFLLGIIFRYYYYQYLLLLGTIILSGIIVFFCQKW